MFPPGVPRSTNYYRQSDDRGFNPVDGQHHQHGMYRIQPNDIHTTNVADPYEFTEISVDGAWEQSFPAPELHNQMMLPAQQFSPQVDISHLAPLPWNDSPSTPNINHLENYTPSRSNAINSSQHALVPRSNASESSLSRQGSEQRSPSYLGHPHLSPSPTTSTYNSYGVLQDHGVYLFNIKRESCFDLMNV
jgi:hypothetical protein